MDTSNLTHMCQLPGSDKYQKRVLFGFLKSRTFCRRAVASPPAPVAIRQNTGPSRPHCWRGNLPFPRKMHMFCMFCFGLRTSK